MSHPRSSSHSSSTLAVLNASHLTHDRGGRPVLADVSLTVGPSSRIGVIGPNGVGKSTLLHLLAGLERPDRGTITVDPPGATVGYLAQEHERRDDETVRDALARRTGVADAERELMAAANDLATNTSSANDRYETALARYESLGADTFDARMATVLREFELSADLATSATSTLSGGQEAKVALAAIELSRFDVVLLDEPTNDLDFDGLARLEAWVHQRHGGTVIVSHDREFLERTVDTVLEIDEHARTARAFAGGWSGYQSERANEERLARERFDEYQRTREQLANRAQRQRQWADVGVRKEVKNPRDHDKAQRDFRINRTENLAHKARQTERAMENLEVVDKPFEGWDLRFSIATAGRSGQDVVQLVAGVVTRGPFQLGPVDLEIAWGDRVAIVGVNGSGKSTLVSALLGTIALSSGTRRVGPSVVTGVLGQDRRALGAEHDLARYVQERSGLTIAETRTVLAKFGLGAEQVTRPTKSLSPGERTRAELAIFQARGVNFLVLDEPTNHLDLPAIEQLESALRDFAGTLVLVTHDRRLLDAVAITRTIEVSDGVVTERH